MTDGATQIRNKTSITFPFRGGWIGIIKLLNDWLLFWAAWYHFLIDLQRINVPMLDTTTVFIPATVVE
jgi:hypothetical protein